MSAPIPTDQHKVTRDLSLDASMREQHSNAKSAYLKLIQHLLSVKKNYNISDKDFSQIISHATAIFIGSQVESRVNRIVEERFSPENIVRLLS